MATEPDPLIQYLGVLKVRDNYDGTTTMRLKITCTAVAGVIDHSRARMVRGDFKTLHEEDLLRIKTVIPHDVP